MGGVGAIFGLIALIFSIYATISTVRTSRHELRAYLQAETGKDPGFTSDTVSLSVNIKNVGQTPAYHVTFRGRISVHLQEPGQLVMDRDPSEEVEAIRALRVPFLGDLTLGAGISIQNDWGTRKLGSNEAEAIATKKGVVYFAGKVIYLDIFGKRHTTHFCHAYTMGKGGLSGSYETIGNHAD